MANRLSHSQLRLFQECPKKYQFHYVDRLREKTRSGALSFGESVDRAFEAIIKDPSINDKEVFDKSFTEQEINKKKTYLPDSLLVVYSYSDYDRDLLTEEDERWLTTKGKELLGIDGTLDSYFDICLKAKKQAKFKKWKDNEKKFYNLCNWHSLRRKGHVMLEAFRKKVLPNLKNIEGTQVKIELANSEGDSVVGFADYVGKYGDDSSRVVLDFKTSTIDYEDDAVLVSPQLTIYAHSLGLKRAGYVVFSKRISKNRTKTCAKCGFDGSGNRMKTCNNQIKDKRCDGEWIERVNPEAEVKVLIDDIPPQTDAIVLENADAINKAITAGIFIRNLNSCRTNYGICPYYSLCFNNKKDNLEKVD